MKKSNIMVNFLMWTIVGLVFLFTAGKLGAEFTSISDSSVKSYSNLISIIEPGSADYIENDERRSMAFSLNKKSVIVGFSKGDNRFENYHYDRNNLGLKSIFLKPVNTDNGCEIGKACICLCQGYELDKDPNPKSAKACEDLLLCHSFDNIDILTSKEAVYYEDGILKNYWQGGFLIHRDVSDSEDVNGYEKNNIPLRTFYIDRYEDVVGVCTERPCITEKIKGYIDTGERAIDVTQDPGTISALITADTPVSTPTTGGIARRDIPITQVTPEPPAPIKPGETVVLSWPEISGDCVASSSPRPIESWSGSQNRRDIESRAPQLGFNLVIPVDQEQGTYALIITCTGPTPAIGSIDILVSERTQEEIEQIQEEQAVSVDLRLKIRDTQDEVEDLIVGKIDDGWGTLVYEIGIGSSDCRTGENLDELLGNFNSPSPHSGEVSVGFELTGPGTSEYKITCYDETGEVPIGSDSVTIQIGE